MNLIASVDVNWAIGKDNQLLFHINPDLARFKQKTLGKVVVMGKNTLLSLPGQEPLTGRVNIVLSTTLESKYFTVCRDLTELFAVLKEYAPSDIFIIGGQQIYTQLLPFCKRAFITKIYRDGEGDCFMKNLDLDPQWTLQAQGSIYNYGKIKFAFCVYVNDKATCF